MPLESQNPYIRSEEAVDKILLKADDIDKIDLRIIWHLQRHGRDSFNEVAKELGLSVATVSKRVSKLEESGVIQGFTAIVACERIGFTDHLWLMVYVKPGVNTEKIGKKIGEFMGVKCVYEIFSDFDLLVHLCCATKDEIDSVIDQIGKVNGVSSVTKMHVSKRIKEEFRVIV